MFEVGKKVERVDGYNVYKVVETSDAFTLLECILFFEEENLGDQIYCSRVHQNIWICNWHAPGFQCAEYRPL